MLLLLAIAAFALGSISVFGAQFDPEIERAFLEGARQLQAGNYAGAESIFRTLLEKTDSPRVRLELARTLFYEGRYAEARALFKEALQDPDMPWRVRDNIEAFVRGIDDVEGYLRPSVSMVSDSNPRNITAQRDFTIGGFQLTYRPPADNKRVTGLRYSVEALEPVLKERRLSAYLNGAYIDYPGDSLDRLTVDMGAMMGLGPANRTVIKGGVEWGTFGNKRLYDFPYAAISRVLNQSAAYRLSGQLKAGRVEFPDYSYLDAGYGSASVVALFAISRDATFSLGGTLEESSARDKPYSYEGLTLAPGASWLVSRYALLVKGSLGVGTRRYAADDPFFGERRVDRKTSLELEIRNKAWRWMKFNPVLRVSLERNRSTLDFYAYRKWNVAISLE